MDIDKILNQWGEEQIVSDDMSQDVREKCWNSIKSNIVKRRKWYDKVMIGYMHVNKRYHMKLIFQIAIALAIVFSLPVLISTTKNYVQKSAWFNNNRDNSNNNANKPKHDDTNKDNPKKTVTDERPEYRYDPNYLKALEKIEELAQKAYSRYSIFSTGQTVVISEKTNPAYEFIIYENSNDITHKPGRKDIFIDSNTLEVRTEPGNILPYEQLFCDNNEDGSPNNEGKEPQKLRKFRVAILIDLVEDIRLNSFSEIYNNIRWDKLPWETKGNSEITAGNSFYCLSKPNIYYRYDENKGKLYRYDINSGEKKTIYDYNTDKFKIFNIEKEVDLDGDGNTDHIKFNILNGILSVNDVTISTASGLDLSDFDIVDIDKSDEEKEIYVKYQGDDIGVTNLYFNYKHGVITNVGVLGGGERPIYEEPIIDGSSNVTFKNVLVQCFESNFINEEYKYYKDNVLRKQPMKEFYETGKMTDYNGNISYKIIKPKKELKIYKDKDSKEVVGVLKVGENVKLIGTDLKQWVLVENSKGIRGWFQVGGASELYVKELNLFSYEVFDGLQIGN